MSHKRTQGRTIRIQICPKSLAFREMQIKTTIRYHLTCQNGCHQSLQITNVGEDVEKRNLHTLLEGL